MCLKLLSSFLFFPLTFFPFIIINCFGLFFPIFWMQIKIEIGSQGRTEMCAQSIAINYSKRIHVGILIVSLMLSSQMADNFIWCTEQFYVLLLKEKMHSQLKLHLCSLLLSEAKPLSFSPMLIRTSNVDIIPSVQEYLQGTQGCEVEWTLLATNLTSWIGVLRDLLQDMMEAPCLKQNILVWGRFKRGRKKLLVKGDSFLQSTQKQHL